jgi:(p)ppGpp synthase/HD superfamily hydrolase
MNIIEKSIEIALRAHGGQKDKAGKAYILHRLRIMARMDTDEEKAVALLHDVIEDSAITKEQLISEGIPHSVADAVQTLTKSSGESYEKFIDRVLENELAVKVKKIDIEDNLDILRLKSVSNKDLERVAKYHTAWIRLSNGS